MIPKLGKTWTISEGGYQDDIGNKLTIEGEYVNCVASPPILHLSNDCHIADFLALVASKSGKGSRVCGLFSRFYEVALPVPFPPIEYTSSQLTVSCPFRSLFRQRTLRRVRTHMAPAGYLKIAQSVIDRNSDNYDKLRANSADD